MRRIEIEIGNVVICDICNRDYTNSTEKGGFVWSGRGICPKCQGDLLKEIKICKEEKYIEAYCPANMSFADFIIEFRGKNAKAILEFESNLDSHKEFSANDELKCENDKCGKKLTFLDLITSHIVNPTEPLLCPSCKSKVNT